MIQLELKQDELNVAFTLADDFMDILVAARRFEELDTPPELTAAGRLYEKLVAARHAQRVSA